MNKIVCISNGPNMSFTPYMAKMAQLLKDMGIQVDFVSWARADDSINTKDPDNINHIILMKKGSEGCNKIYLLWLYIVWMVKILFFVLRSKENKFMCSRFEAAFPVYLASLIKKIDYIYCDRDNLHSTYKWNFFLKKIILNIERKIGISAKVHLIPGVSRDYTGSDNVFIVENMPSSVLFKKAYDLFLDRKGHYSELITRNVVYINGWLKPTRGLLHIKNFLESHIREDVVVIIAGSISNDINKIVEQNDSVIYLGNLSSIESLSYYFFSDVVVSLYDPSIDINIQAEPNKWWDCTVTKTPFITNYGIETVKNFDEIVDYYLIDYSQENSLVKFFDKFVFQAKDAGLFDKEGEVVLWDDKMKNVINFFWMT